MKHFADFLSNTIIGKRKHTISEFFYRYTTYSTIRRYQIYPAGYYADDASILLFCNNNGIASTEESLIVYRKSENNISSSSCWNVEKSKAALKYYQWIIDEFPMKQQDEQIIQQRLDFDFVYLFSSSIKYSSIYPNIKLYSSQHLELEKEIIMSLQVHIKILMQSKLNNLLFLIESLSGGGAEKVLTTLLQYLDSNKFDVTLCCIVDCGKYVNDVKPYVHYTSILPNPEQIKGIRKLIYQLKYKLIYSWLPLRLVYKWFVPHHADVEIAFVEGFATKLLAHSTNKQAKKIAWVHTVF